MAKKTIRRRKFPAESFGNQLIGFFGVAFLEALDAAGGVHVFLLAREKRMAFRADADAQILAGGARFDDVAARAMDDGVNIFGMDLGFHV
jgi:hypothetical protein